MDDLIVILSTLLPLAHPKMFYVILFLLWILIEGCFVPWLDRYTFCKFR
jgi:hypothetical protein